MANEIQAHEIIVSYNGEAISKATSWSLQVDKQIIDITTLDDVGWANGIGGEKAWSVSVEGLVNRTSVTGKTNYNKLMLALFTNDTPVDIKISSNISGDTFYAGKAIIASLSKSGSKGEIVSYSASFTGCGPLDDAVVPATV